MWRASLLGFAAVSLLGFGRPLFAEPLLVDQYLQSGKLAEGEKVLAERIAAEPKNDQLRFSLGALQFIRAIEHLGQSLHQYGLRSDHGQRMGAPFLRLPIPVNPNPKVLTYKQSRQIMQALIDDLAKAESTLAKIGNKEVKLPLQMGLIRLDFTADGTPGDSFSAVLAQYLGGRQNEAVDQEWLVAFDRGDVAWLRGYCHLLMALSEMTLAYDGQRLFDCTAHMFFEKVETPHEFLTDLSSEDRPFVFGGINILDAIAFVHLLRCEVTEPERMKAALAHLETMLALSKESWKYVMAETDDEREWLPNPKQTSVINVPVRQEMIDSWLEFVDESAAVLAGKRLLPFWRGAEKRGVNLRRVFTEPRAMDLLLWIQGTAATPYLEDGPLTQPEVWRRMAQVFRGQFVGIAIWFN